MSEPLTLRKLLPEKLFAIGPVARRLLAKRFSFQVAHKQASPAKLQ